MAATVTLALSRSRNAALAACVSNYEIIPGKNTTFNLPGAEQGNHEAGSVELQFVQLLFDSVC